MAEPITVAAGGAGATSIIAGGSSALGAIVIVALFKDAYPFMILSGIGCLFWLALMDTDTPRERMIIIIAAASFFGGFLSLPLAALFNAASLHYLGLDLSTINIADGLDVISSIRAMISALFGFICQKIIPIALELWKARKRDAQ